MRALRFDSLFSRLLLAQLGLVSVLAVVFGLLFQAERNTTAALLYADLWGPQLARATGLATPAVSLPVRRLDAAPAGAQPVSGAPRFRALRRALAEQGVVVDQMSASADGPDTVLWLRVLPPGAAPVWLGVGGQLVVPEWPERLLLAIGLLALVLVGVSWAFTRRLTRPLEALRARIQAHAPGGRRPAPPPLAGVSPEISAIDLAWSDLLARLERHERERAVLLAGVSHDLRSPLGRIRMAAHLLPDDAQTAPRKASITRYVAEADRLIESFLDFVRAGQLGLDETVDLAAIARGVAARFERPAGDLQVLAPDTLAWPRANGLLVERLIANLIDNAFKHGRLPVTLRVALGDGAATIDVEDRGDGISAEALAGLQEAFVRGDASRAVPGTGLGLAIVRQVADRLSGQVSFERLDGVQRVRVKLPRGTA